MQLPLPKNIDTMRVFKYIGAKSDNENALQLVNKAFDLIAKTAVPSYTVKRFDTIPPEVVLGTDIQKHLSGCFGVVFLSATLGLAVDQLIKKIGVTDVFFQVVLDATASVVLEQAVEDLECDLRNTYQQNGLFLTLSYAPGYGDYPLEVLPVILGALSAQKQVGITLTESGLMLPRKSICSCLGLANKPVLGFRAGCEHCKLNQNCKLRKEGKTCVR